MSPRTETISEVLRRLPQAILVSMLSLVLGVAGLAPALAKGPEEGLGLRLELSPKTLIAGQEGTLVLSLVDAAGEPQRTQRDLEIRLDARPAGLLKTSSVRLRSGFSRVEVALSPERSDTWSIQAGARGLFSAQILAVAVAAEKVRAKPTAHKGPPAREIGANNTAPQGTAPREIGDDGPTSEVSAGAEVSADLLVRAQPISRAPVTEDQLIRQKGLRPELAAKILELEPNVALPEETTPRAGEDPGDGELTELGELRLVSASPLVHRGADGFFRGILQAVWHEGGKPSPRQSDLPLQFAFIPTGGDHQLEPAQAVLGTGETFLWLEVHSTTQGEVQVVALYDGFLSNKADFNFLPAKPKQLMFSSDYYSLRGLNSKRLEFSLRLLDASGALAANDKLREITLTIRGSDGERNQKLEIPPEDFEASAAFEIRRFGRYTLEASGLDLDSAKAEVRLRFDFFLLLIALLGGMLGSFTRLLLQREHDWKKDLKRALVLGVVAALLAVPLALFGLLSALSSIFPEGLLEALSALPSENHLAMFFIGLVAGLALEPLLAFFTRLRSQGTQGTEES